MGFYTSEKRLFGNKQSAVQCTVHVEKEFIFNSTKAILGATYFGIKKEESLSK